MSDDCRNINLLQRDGTSRQQRLLKALLPDYVAVDERKMEDLKSFALQYARQIKFYSLSGSPTGDEDWESFFDKKLDPDQRTEPHYALFLSFLQLFKIAQDDLNQITRRHLDFYYRDVLQLKEKKAVADQAFIIFELAKHVNQHLLKEGTRFKAGKDDSGTELLYEANRDLVINRATVGEIKAVFRDENSRIYASPVADSADGLGAEIESAEGNWRTFGRPEGNWTQEERPDRPQAEIGFAFASPILFLAEGDREITVRLKLKEAANPTRFTETLTALNLREAFRVRFSGEEDWIEAATESEGSTEGEIPPAVVERILDFLNSAATWQDIAGVEPKAGPVFDDPEKGYGDQVYDYDIGEVVAKRILAARSSLGAAGFTDLDQVRAVKGVGRDKIDDLAYTFRDPDNSTTIDVENREIVIRRTITKAQDPIVAYVQNDKKLLDPFQTIWPVVKITLDTDSNPYLYGTLQDFKLDSAAISVRVCEVRELIIQNDQSVLDPGKDFQPFGIRPEIGSNFYIGSREVFSKQLEMLKIHLLWHGLPEETFADYYNEYIDNDRTNDSFQANIYVLDKKAWVSLDTDGGAKALFTGSGAPEPKRVVSITNVGKLEKVRRNTGLEPFEAFDTDTRKGFLRLELHNTDFGHKDYQASYTKQVLTAFAPSTSNPDPPDPAVQMPNEPYTPLLKEVFLNYRSSVDIDLSTAVSQEEFDERIEQYFHVGAFGVAEQETVATDPPNQPNLSLFPQYRSEGSLYIGMDDFTAGQTLSLLFQVAEGSADPDLEPQPVRWSYLADNRWIDFDKFDILSDGTSGLLTSGIIRFDVSKKATDRNSLLPSGRHWIRASVDRDSDAVSDLIDIMAQAVTVSFKDRDNDPGHLKEALPAETIAKLKVADSAIDKIRQPFASFGGKVKEQQSAFYTRVSERLRHKNRAVAIWDYERLVLEQFPSAYKVKCVNHARYTGSLADYSELAPGHVTVVVISNVRNKNAVDPLRPKTSLITLTNINEFLSDLHPAGIDLHVKNPIYEEIQVALNVRFFQGFDNGFYGKQLEDDLKAFLSPWAFEASSELVFGGKIHKSVILNYVEERSYVDFVTCFEMYHIIKNPGTGAVVSRKKVDEAVASTAISILGSTGEDGRYGDHLITVLETDECACEDNEVRPTATIASVDDCPPDQDQMFEM